LHFNLELTWWEFTTESLDTNTHSIKTPLLLLNIKVLTAV